MLRVFRPTRLLITALALLLPGLVLLPAWRLGGLGAGEDDILYYFPLRTYLGNLLAEGWWPWLNPWTGCDRPLLADPQIAVFYPLTALFAVLPPAVAYAASLWLHVSLALGGGYRLARSQRLRQGPALLAGVVFALGGFLIAHRAHLTLLHAAAWTPWVFWRLAVFSRDGGARNLAVSAGVAALQCYAGHVQIAALTALGSAVWLWLRCARPWAALLRALLTWVCAAALFAAQILPTLAALRETTRMQRSFSDFVENSYHPFCLLTWWMPMLPGQRTPNVFDQPWWGPSHQCEQLAYAGILPLLLVIGLLRSGRPLFRDKRAWLWLGALALLAALGKYGPVSPLLYWLPGANVFRVPARALLLVQLAAAMLAAGVLDELLSRLSARRVRLQDALARLGQRPLRLAALALGAALAACLIAAPWVGSETRATMLVAWRPWSAAVWLPMMLLLAAAVVLRRIARRPSLLTLGLGAGLLLADLSIIGWSVDIPRGVSSAQDLLQPHGAEWESRVRDGGGRLWTLTPRENEQLPPGEYRAPLAKRVANTHMLAAIPVLTDYGPLQSSAMHALFGFKPWGETPDWRSILASDFWRRDFNVRWLLLCDPSIPIPEACTLEAITARGDRLIHNPSAAGWAFTRDATCPAIVQYASDGPYRFRVRVTPRPGDNAPVEIIVSRLALPGWTIEHQGAPLPITRARGALLSVTVPGGAPSEVIGRFHPPGLSAGLSITLVSGVILASAALRERRRPAEHLRR